MAPSVAGNTGREGTVATVEEAIEPLGEEEEQEPVEEAEAAATDAETGEGAAAGLTSKVNGDEAPPEISGSVAGEESAGGHITEHATGNAQEVAETNGRTAPETASSATTDPTYVKNEVLAGHADAGDISMKTDVGEIQAMISELVDGAAKEAEPTPILDADKEATNLDTDSSSVPVISEPPVDTAASGSKDASAPPAIPSSPSKRSAEETQALADSAENMASAYKTRTRRRSSFSSVDSEADPPETDSSQAGPSLNRLSILYEESSRRLCFDATIVDKVKIHRKDGRIEVVFCKDLASLKEEEGDALLSLPKGILVSKRCEGRKR